MDYIPFCKLDTDSSGQEGPSLWWNKGVVALFTQTRHCSLPIHVHQRDIQDPRGVRIRYSDMWRHVD